MNNRPSLVLSSGVPWRTPDPDERGGGDDLFADCFVQEALLSHHSRLADSLLLHVVVHFYVLIFGVS